MLIAIVVLISLVVIVLAILFYFLNKRVDNMGRRLGTIYATIDVLHKNQEGLLAQNLRMFSENAKKRKERK